MSKVVVTESHLEDIADAIRGKLGSQSGYTPGQMAAAIESIPTGGITPTGTKNITQNGVEDVTQYASANVNVPNTYAAGDEGKVVSNGALVAQTARSSQITENGTYDTTNNNSVTVSVSGGGSATLITKNITQNGTYSASSDNADGYSQVSVNVSGGGGNDFVNDFKVGRNSNALMKIIKNRVVTNTGNYNYRCIYLEKTDMQALNIDPSKDFEIGIAFKRPDFNNVFTLFGTIGSNAAPMSHPSMDMSGSTLSCGYSLKNGSATAWGNYVNLGTLVVDTWYFARIKYTASTSTLTMEYTDDFTNWETTSVQLSQEVKFNSATYGFGFGSWSSTTDRSTTALIDLHNTYIKKEGSIVFGKFTGQFPAGI